MEFFKRKCKHDYEKIGLFYKEYLTEYRNAFDSVVAYRKERCKKCGNIINVPLAREFFMPELHKGRDERKDEYIKYLRGKGYKLEIDL